MWSAEIFPRPNIFMARELRQFWRRLFENALTDGVETPMILTLILF